MPGAEAPSVVVAALGPIMLRIAGELTDGVLATWTGLRTVGEHIVPRTTAAAEAAGRPSPRVIVRLPVAVTDDGDAARTWVAERFGMAGDLPSYRAVLDIEGVEGVHEVVVAGDEDTVAHRLGQLRDAGVTEFIAVPFGPAHQARRTLQLLSEVNRAVGVSPSGVGAAAAGPR